VEKISSLLALTALLQLVSSERVINNAIRGVRALLGRTCVRVFVLRVRFGFSGSSGRLLGRPAGVALTERPTTGQCHRNRVLFARRSVCLPVTAESGHHN
jgi:hypothetical protein